MLANVCIGIITVFCLFVNLNIFKTFSLNKYRFIPDSTTEIILCRVNRSPCTVMLF